MAPGLSNTDIMFIAVIKLSICSPGRSAINITVDSTDSIKFLCSSNDIPYFTDVAQTRQFSILGQVICNHFISENFKQKFLCKYNS